jgi:hypothetical protein
MAKKRDVLTPKTGVRLTVTWELPADGTSIEHLMNLAEDTLGQHLDIGGVRPVSVRALTYRIGPAGQPEVTP